MRANELQVNDFVLVDDKPIKIKQITKKKIGYHLGERECRMHYSRICEITLIELSEDFIEDTLGFGRNQINGSPSWECNIENEYHITINTYSNAKGRNYSVHIDNRDFDTIGSCDVRYLHQLQQIVRLVTGKELEVIL